MKFFSLMCEPKFNFRYWEGRKLWSTMEVLIRHTTRNIWIGVREDGKVKSDKIMGDAKPEIIIEKRTAINLLLGFEYAAKHYLREEFGYHYDDLKPLISNIQSNLPGFKTSAESDDEHDEYNSNVAGLYSRMFRKKIKPHQREKGKGHMLGEKNLPLDITLYLSSYCQTQMEQKRIDAPLFNQLLANLNGLSDCLSQFERILRSPIPLAYSIHLNQAVWIYCVSLPFFMVSSSHWATIPVVFIVTLVLFGLERIGSEIENPFGYDDNDLDLDEFCE
jgi:ion channel-forming bestrophin family protein